METKWGDISKDVMMFGGCYAQVVNLNESGTNENDRIQKAHALYIANMQVDDKPFKFKHCWQYLRNVPK